MVLSGECCFARGGDSTLSKQAFERAVALNVDPFGIFTVVDAGSNQVFRLDSSGRVLSHTGGYGWTSTALDRPADIAMVNGLEMYVADYGNHRIVRLDRNLALVSTLPPAPLVPADRAFGYPRSVAVSRFGDLLLVDGENNEIVKLAGTGDLERTFGGLHAGKGRLLNPLRVRIGGNDIVCVQDGGAIVFYDVFGNYVNTLPPALFHGLTTWTCAGTMLLTVDSLGISVWNNLPAASFSRRIPFADLPVGYQDVSDLALFDNELVVLTTKELIRTKVLVREIDADEH